MKLLIFLLILLVLFSGCSQQPTENEIINKAKEACIDLCNSVKSTRDLSNGPCLSDNNPDWNIEDWVCDVAHSPRQDIDNLPENQCQTFRSGKAHHFVEVDTNCNLIKVI